MISPYWQDEYTTIYHGDCAQIAPMMDDYDLLLTDPPYGINENHKKIASRGKLANPKNYGDCNWDKQPPPAWLLSMLRSKSENSIIFGGNFFDLPPASCFLVWDKDNTANDFADCELAWTNLPQAVRKFTWRWNGMLQEDMKNKEIRVHPTQKPLALMLWCLDQAPTAKTIFDPFMGSGTTLVAARQRGLKAVGIEQDERYCEAAAERLSQMKLNLFQTEGVK